MKEMVICVERQGGGEERRSDRVSKVAFFSNQSDHRTDADGEDNQVRVCRFALRRWREREGETDGRTDERASFECAMERQPAFSYLCRGGLFERYSIPLLSMKLYSYSTYWTLICHRAIKKICIVFFLASGCNTVEPKTERPSSLAVAVI